MARTLRVPIAGHLSLFCLRGNRVCGVPSHFYNTVWGLLPPVIAIALALITKEVYSSLFIGILVGGLLYSNFSFEGTVRHVFWTGSWPPCRTVTMWVSLYSL